MTTSYSPHSGAHKGRSALAVLAGLITIFVMSLGIDQLFHMLAVYPGWGVPMVETSDFVLATSYRLVINTFGCWLAARLAPQNPMKHALILGWIGLALSTLGVLFAVANEMGPLWYPVLLALSAVPCAWLGGMLYTRRSHSN